MEFHANEGKNVIREVHGHRYARHAITTHFVKSGESYVDLVKKYVVPVYQEGDIVSASEKVIAICQGRLVYKKDLKVGALAKFLSHFAGRTEQGAGAGCVWKMQFAIDLHGPFKVIWAAICGGFGKLVGKHGVFYTMLGREVSGMDGFLPEESFEEYGDYGIRVPEDPTGVCNKVYAETGVKLMIIDANDINREILAHCDAITNPVSELVDMIDDNPAGQEKELTPFILIRDVTNAEA